MKKILLVVILLTTLTIVSQKKKETIITHIEQVQRANDSLQKKLTSLNNELKKTLDENSKVVNENSKLKTLYVDFEKRLAYLETREDSFSSSLKMQTGLFSLIVTVVLLIVGFFSWFNLKNEKEHIEKLTNLKINNLETKFKNYKNQIINQFESKKQSINSENNKNLKRIEDSFKEKTSKLTKLEEHSLLTMGNLNAELGNRYSEQKDWEHAIFFSIKGAQDLNNYVFFYTDESFDNQEREDLQVVLTNLDNCIAYIQNAKEENKLYDTSPMRIILDDFSTKNSYIKDKLATIRINLKDITKKQTN